MAVIIKDAPIVSSEVNKISYPTISSLMGRLGINVVRNSSSAGAIQSDNFVTGASGAGWQLTAEGNLEATSGTFRGALAATSGTIGGTTISATALTSGVIRTASSGSRIEMDSGGLNIVGTLSSLISFWPGGTIDTGDAWFIYGLADGIYIESDLKVVGSILPNTDNLYPLGSATKRWSDMRSVLINGADIGFANGWKFREWPAKKEDIEKPPEWMKANANQGIQLLDENDNLIAVFHKNGTIYCNGIKLLNKLVIPNL